MASVNGGWMLTVLANASSNCLLVAGFALPDARSDPEIPWLHTVDAEDETTHSAVVSPVQEGEGLLTVVARCAQVVWHLQYCTVSDGVGCTIECRTLYALQPVCIKRE